MREDESSAIMENDGLPFPSTLYYFNISREGEHKSQTGHHPKENELRHYAKWKAKASTTLESAFSLVEDLFLILLVVGLSDNIAENAQPP